MSEKSAHRLLVDAFKKEQAENRKFRKLSDEAPTIMEKVLFQEAWRIMGRSLKLAPIDTGLLRASARVTIPTREGNVVGVSISYTTNYASYVHDRTDDGNPTGNPVPYKAPGTQSKFLEEPMEEGLDEMERRVSARLNVEVRRIVG